MVICLRSPAHDSGPMRFAIPSSYGTFTHYLSPVLTGAPRADPSCFPYYRIESMVIWQKLVSVPSFSEVEARLAAPQRRSAPDRCSLARVSAPENGELGTARGPVLRERSDRRTRKPLTCGLLGRSYGWLDNAFASDNQMPNVGV
jgi:hypothetical protein